MSGPSYELQVALVAQLRADAGVAALVGARVYDGPPPSPTFPYISLGNSDFLPDDADCVTQREETLQIDVWSDRHGSMVEARQIVDAVKSALHKQRPTLTTHACTALEVFLARVLLDQDGMIAHGIVQVTAMVEEN